MAKAATSGHHKNSYHELKAAATHLRFKVHVLIVRSQSAVFFHRPLIGVQTE
jgi:hypothetical protein